jgi:hypothetical protein
MTPRRLALRAIEAMSKVPAGEIQWLWVYLMTGQRPPVSEQTFERDQAIRRYRERWHSKLSQRSAAVVIAFEASTYRGGEWRHHRRRRSIPQELINTPRGDLFAIFELGEVPDADQVRAILRRPG